MSDTIEWLETIGKNANLRHAPADELAKTLDEGGASEVLKAAVKFKDSALLSAELGHKPMKVDHNPHTGGHEEENPDHDHDQDSPPQPPQPNPNEPSRDK